jgi:hypothetical protein
VSVCTLELDRSLHAPGPVNRPQQLPSTVGAHDMHAAAELARSAPPKLQAKPAIPRRCRGGVAAALPMQWQEKASGEKHVCTTHSTGSLKASTFKWLTKYCASRMYDQPQVQKRKKKNSSPNLPACATGVPLHDWTCTHAWRSPRRPPPTDGRAVRARITWPRAPPSHQVQVRSSGSEVRPSLLILSAAAVGPVTITHRYKAAGGPHRTPGI